MRKFTRLAVIVCTLLMSVIALAASEIPNMKGTWVGKGVWVQIQKTPEPDPNIHGIPKSGLQQMEFTYIIDKQEEFHFTGTKSSRKHKESIAGVIGFDNKTAYVVDHNGMEFWRILSADKIELIYVHTTKDDSIASRCVLIRKH